MPDLTLRFPGAHPAAADCGDEFAHHGSAGRFAAAGRVGAAAAGAEPNATGDGVDGEDHGVRDRERCRKTCASVRGW